MKDWIIDHFGQCVGTMRSCGLQYETAMQEFNKNLQRDVNNYFYQMELNTKKGAQYKKPKVAQKKTKAQIENQSDWAHDQMVDNRLTLGI